VVYRDKGKDYFLVKTNNRITFFRKKVNTRKTLSHNTLISILIEHKTTALLSLCQYNPISASDFRKRVQDTTIQPPFLMLYI